MILEVIYDSVYEDARDDIYDGIYEDLFGNLYDAYYDGILKDAHRFRGLWRMVGSSFRLSTIRGAIRIPKFIDTFRFRFGYL